MIRDAKGYQNQNLNITFKDSNNDIDIKNSSELKVAYRYWYDEF